MTNMSLSQQKEILDPQIAWMYRRLNYFLNLIILPHHSNLIIYANIHIWPESVKKTIFKAYSILSSNKSFSFGNFTLISNNN